MITVDKQDAITLKINHAMAKTKKLDMDVYLFIPGELGLTPEVLSESAFSTAQSLKNVPTTVTRHFYLWCTVA